MSVGHPVLALYKIFAARYNVDDAYSAKSRRNLSPAKKGVGTIKYDVFISYRRDGGEYTAKILRDRLQELGYATFFDVESLRSGDFNTKLYSVIDECRDFILILSPCCLERCRNEDDWVRREVEFALERGKNIVPVMLRGFEFPSELPASIEQLRYKNGIQANTEFFEAFLEKLRSFLVSKPPFWQRLIQNPLFRRTLPVFLALLLVCAVGTGIYIYYRSHTAVYPKTAEEKNLVTELLYYVETDLTKLDLMATAIGKALDEAQRYVSGGSTADTALEAQFDKTRLSLENTELSGSAPSERLLEQLTSSPLSPSEFVALHGIVSDFIPEYTRSLAHIDWMVSSDCAFSSSEKLRIIDCYRVELDETMRTIGYATNQALLPITSKPALDDFLHRYLPTLTSIPLSATSWSQDEAALVSAQDECWNKMQEAVLEMTAITGEHSVEVAVMRDNLIRQYMSAGISRTQAELYVERYLPRIREIYDTFSPAEGDSETLLWTKLRVFMTAGIYDGAVSCVDALEALVGESDPYAAEYIPALRAFAGSADTTGIDYGVMVVGFDEEGRANPKLQIGDVIVAFNGQACPNVNVYQEGKQALEGTAYTVDVLRPDGNGGMESLTLELDTGMPRVLLANLSNNT